MKFCICYPPLRQNGKTACLSQNRQFQWFSNPSYFYPVVPASAATLLKANGYEVMFKDCIAENCSNEEFYKYIDDQQPDVIVFEAKTPAIKRIWKIIDKVKVISAKTKVAMVGDHVTAMPVESLLKSKTDFVITGGDYDFLLLNLAKHINEGTCLEPGIHFKVNGKIISSGRFKLNNNLDSLPRIDRLLTKYKNYSIRNGNFKNKPGTYIMSARDCWWGRCSFCSWTTLYPGKTYRCRSPQNVVDEIEYLVNHLGIKEIMDDSGTFPRETWLESFCRLMIDKGFNNTLNLNCNLRLGVLKADDYRLMKEAGFRLILCGVESANQKTLDLINKNLKVRQIIDSLVMAKEAGLEPHLTVMVGYPWETEKEALNTVKMAKKLFADGLADTLQATIVTPYPGTPLFKYCYRKGLLKTLNWDDYGMGDPVMKSPISDERLKGITRDLYRSFINPNYILRKLTSIKNFQDVKYLLNSGTKVIGHLRDFKTKPASDLNAKQASDRRVTK